MPLQTPSWFHELPAELVGLLRNDNNASNVMRIACVNEWDRVKFLEELAIALAKQRNDLIDELYKRAVRDISILR